MCDACYESSIDDILELHYDGNRCWPTDEDAAEECTHPDWSFDRTICGGCDSMPDVCVECGWHDCRTPAQDEEAGVSTDPAQDREPGNSRETLHPWPDSDAARFLAHERAQRSGTARGERP